MQQRKPQHRINSKSFILGLLAPIFGMATWFFAYFERKGLTFDQFIQSFGIDSPTRTRFMILGMLFLFPLFMYYYNRHDDASMRGVLSATFVYALIMVIMLVL